METTNQALTTTKSLLAQFNNAKEKKNYKGEIYYPDRNSLGYELRTLLEQEQNGWRCDRWSYNSLDNEQIEEAKRIISLYQEVFDWDTQYSVEVQYELSPSTMNYNKDVNSLEELKKYLSKDKAVELPESGESCWEQIDYGYEIYDEEWIRAGVEIKNLRLKEKENEYSIILTVKSKKDVEYIQDNFLQQSALQLVAEANDISITASSVVTSK